MCYWRLKNGEYTKSVSLPISHTPDAIDEEKLAAGVSHQATIEKTGGTTITNG